MKSYNVTCVCFTGSELESLNNNTLANYPVADNYAGDYIKAKSELDAIDIAIECIIDILRNYTDCTDIKIEHNTITVYDDDGKEIYYYCDFEAKEIE